METYNSVHGHMSAINGQETPWIREFAPKGSFSWKEITRLDGDRYVVAEEKHTRENGGEYSSGGYIWGQGMLLGENDLSRTFVAPRDGLCQVEGEGEISLYFFNSNRSCIRLMHNDQVIWPTPGEYEDDFFPVTYEHNSFFPTQFIEVKKGDTLRFIGRNRGEGQVDDVWWVVNVNYLPATFLAQEMTLKVGESVFPAIHNETGKTPTFVSDNDEVVKVAADGRLTAVSPGPSLVHAHFGNDCSSELLVWVGDSKNVQNPYDLAVDISTPHSIPGAGIPYQTLDTLQLAVELGQAETNYGHIPASAIRFDNPGEGVKLPEEGLRAAEVNCTFTDAYLGGRTLKDISVSMMTTREIGKLYHLELWYNTVSDPGTFYFLYGYRVPGVVSHGCYPTIQVNGFDGRITDVLTVRVLFRSVQGYPVLLKEIDINFEDDGVDVQGLRRAKLAKIWLPTVFADKMMFQRDKPVRVWGFDGVEGEVVTVTLTENGKTDRAEAKIKDGKWLCELPAHPASTAGAVLTVIYREQTFTYSDIWFGDLWWAGGQSNMEVVMGSEPKEEQERLAARMTPDDKIRWYRHTQGAADSPRKDVHNGTWIPVCPENFRCFSAVALNFIFELYSQTDIPMGILYGAIGATKLEAWLPEEELVKLGEDYAKRFTTWFHRRQYDGEIWYRPVGPFYQMVEPMTNFNLKGLIWYQGEGNSRDERDYPYYEERLHYMVDCWGRRFRAPNMPFVAPQLAPFSMSADGVYGFCCIREAFLNAALDYDNFEVAFIGDTADETHDCHPPNKDIVGQRMAHPILGSVYGIPGVHQGPIPKKIEKDGEKFVIGFDHVGDGLVSNDGEPLRHFEMSEDNKNFIPAIAQIVGDTIVVAAEGIKNPVQVRYAFSDCPKVNFFNKNGFVATPFRMNLDGLMREPKE